MDDVSQERWHRIVELFGEIRELTPEERDDFWVSAAGSDSALRQEVEALLKQDSDTGRFLEPAWSLDSRQSLVGQQLSHYKITEKIGTGGMGEVYRGHDTRLRRDVAIKVTGGIFTERFEREARMVAALNHPHVCTLHDVGPNYLVMELVEGPTLAERISQGTMPLEESREIAVQIARALEAAHEKGIVHRDLKPGNIKVKTDGSVKVLDFGLAKSDPSVASIDVPNDKTGTGVIMGTAGYMSPEQARGKPVDKRTDIFAFGVVLYEMLTGGPPFPGETSSDCIAAVLQKEPDWSRVPAPARRLVRRCLEKDPRNRLRDIGDALWELENFSDREVRLDVSPRRSSHTWPRVLAVCAVVAILATGVAWLAKPAKAVPFRRFELAAGMLGRAFALSPDGTRIAYASGQNLYVRRFDSPEVQDLGELRVDISALAGGVTIFWSPDSQMLAFSSEGSIRSIPASGGTPFVICKTPATGSIVAGVWNTDGTILFSVFRDSVYRVAATGGKPEVFVPIDPSTDVDFHRVSVLPDGRILLNTHRRLGLPRQLEIYDGRKRTVVFGAIRDIGNVSYVVPGYLMFHRDQPNQGVWAIPYTSGPMDLAKAVLLESGAIDYVSGRDGSMLAVLPNPPVPSELTWVDRSGRVTRVRGTDISLGPGLSMSPDGRRAAFVSADLRDVFVRDLDTGIDTRLTFDNRQTTEFTSWSPSGDEVIYAVGGGGIAENDRLYARRVDGTGSLRELIRAGNGRVSRDGHYLIYPIDEGGTRHLRYSEISTDGKIGPPLRIFQPEDPPVALTEYDISPDGKLLAYTVVSPTGQPSVFLTQFPSGNGRWQVSSGTATSMPQFSPTGRELFYVSQPGKLMSVPITAQSPLKLGLPGLPLDLTLPETKSLNIGLGYGVSPDGSRLLIARTLPSQTQSRVVFLQNWPAAIPKP